MYTAQYTVYYAVCIILNIDAGYGEYISEAGVWLDHMLHIFRLILSSPVGIISLESRMLEIEEKVRSYEHNKKKHAADFLFADDTDYNLHCKRSNK